MKRVQSIVSSLAALSPVRVNTDRVQRNRGAADAAMIRARHDADWARCDTSRYAHAGAEPSLDEMLEDPMVWQRARADGLELADLRRVLAAAQAR